MCECNKNCQNCSNDHSVQSPERRKFLGLAVGAINAVVGIAVIGPVVGFIGAPLLRKAKGQWVSIAQFDDLPVRGTKEVSFSMSVKDGYQTVDHRYTVYIKRDSEDVTAFDPACTHLGCRITYQGDKSRYFCPCHGGVFDEDGNVVSGPPPRPLARYETKVEDGQVWLYREV